uniref:RING-type E3 ubiquitin transferase n=1 Tax=Sander lucioperca TaxID=283035 RepID=A0A8D0ATU9_SANLU
MDESSSLLDLLECSVCLERLDTTAKVLPCQHTFCRRCLENIVSSRNELRCPECRILVDCGVDDLPANILLVRLLDGIKQRPQRGSGGGVGGRQSLAGGSLQGYAAGISASPPALPCGKALYSYEGKEPGDLQFSKGDIIILRRKVDDNWYHGELNGCHGFLPASYIQLLRPLSQTPPQGKALYDFEVKDKDQDKDCLAFRSGCSKISAPSSPGSPGSPGPSSSRPSTPLANSVNTASPASSPQTAAAQLKNYTVFITILSLYSLPASVFVCSSLSLRLFFVSPSSSSFTPSIPQKERKAGGLLKLLSGAAAKKKPRSPPSSPPTHDPSLSGQGSCPMASHGRAGSCPIESEMAGAIGLEPLHRKSGSLDTNFPMSPPATRASNALMCVKTVSVCGRYRVVVPYPPQSEAEIELREGDVVFVHKKREDGWYKGTLQRTGQTGLFPSSFVESF